MAIRRVSFHDVVKLQEFSHLRPIDLLHPKMDGDVFPFLFKLGGDIDKPVSVQACKHRDIDGNMQLGYCYVLYERVDADWLASGHASVEARIAACKDPHLAADLYVCSKQGIGESGFKAMCVNVMGKDGTTKKDINMMLDKDWKITQDTIRVLQDIQESIRGKLSDNENILFEE